MSLETKSKNLLRNGTQDPYSLKKHRDRSRFNAVQKVFLGALVLLLLVLGISNATAHDSQDTEKSQLVSDEGIRYEPYKDQNGKWHIGVGHLIKPGESFGKLTLREVHTLFGKDYDLAHESVHKRYPWAEKEVVLVLTNMTFQLGVYNLAGFKDTLKYLEAKEYESASWEMLDSKWAVQTPKRALRLSKRIRKVAWDLRNIKQ